MNKKETRLRRARKTRARIAQLKKARLSVHRSDRYIYAQVFDGEGQRVVAAASSLEPDLRKEGGANVQAAARVGKLIAQRAQAQGVKSLVFDRSGFHYHGRVKALAEAAREDGLEF